MCKILSEDFTQICKQYFRERIILNVFLTVIHLSSRIHFEFCNIFNEALKINNMKLNSYLYISSNVFI